MNNKEYMKELNKLVKRYKKKALERRVRVPKHYMSWDDFAGIASNCISHLLLNGGELCQERSIISAGLMSNIAIIPGAMGVPKCYCVSPEFVDAYTARINSSYDPIDLSIVFIPSFTLENVLAEIAVVMMFDNETQTFNFLIVNIHGEELKVSTRCVKLLELNNYCPSVENSPTMNLCVLCLDALATLNDRPEYHDIDAQPRSLGFRESSQLQTSVYEYPTMLKPRILPVNPSRIDHGGTHASPRPHDRRGHWRRKPKGDTSDLIWVKPSKVGVHK